MTDSPWAVVAGIAKSLNLPLEYALYDMSYSNAMLYGASLPQYIPKDKRGEDNSKGNPKYNGTAYGTETIKADDPRNKDKVKQFFATLRD